MMDMSKQELLFDTMHREFYISCNFIFPIIPLCVLEFRGLSVVI